MNGPGISGYFDLYCGGGEACAYSQIYAQNASFFYFELDESSTNAAGSGLSIWFPPKNGTYPDIVARAYIFAPNSNLIGGRDLLQFYALNGWLDVDIEYGGDSWYYHNGIMHCNVNYIDSCEFALESWSCDEANPVCDHPILYTSDPTVSPTAAPSVYPNEPPNLLSSSIPTVTPKILLNGTNDIEVSEEESDIDVSNGIGNKNFNVLEVVLISVIGCMVLFAICCGLVYCFCRSKNQCEHHQPEGQCEVELDALMGRVDIEGVHGVVPTGIAENER